MSQLPDAELTISIARDVVAQIAPEELPFFSVISAAYKRNPRSVRRQQAVKDNDLGFGVGETVQVLAPTILLVVQQVLIKMSSDATEKGAGTLFRRLGEKIFRSSSSRKQQNQPGSPRYLLIDVDIEVYAYKAARKFVPEAKANEIAKALVENLEARKAELEKL